MLAFFQHIQPSSISIASAVFNVLPVWGLLTAFATPHQLFYNTKPLIGNVCIFGCPAIVKCWAPFTSTEYGVTTKTNQLSKASELSSLDFHLIKKVFYFILPLPELYKSLEMLSSMKTFRLYYTTPWQQHHKSLLSSSDKFNYTQYYRYHWIYWHNRRPCRVCWR